jgi:hypothetical protein
MPPQNEIPHHRNIFENNEKRPPKKKLEADCRKSQNSAATIACSRGRPMTSAVVEATTSFSIHRSAIYIGSLWTVKTDLKQLFLPT